MSANCCVSDKGSGAKQDLEMNFMTDLQKRRSYHRTVRELRRLPLDIALDLNIYPGDAEKIAYQAVYGK